MNGWRSGLRASEKWSFEKMILTHCASRSCSQRIEFRITPNDLVLPERCPFLGVILNYSVTRSRDGDSKDDWATIDRVDGSKGYVPGNVQIISHLANRMKNSASVEQLITFAENILKRYKPKPASRSA